MTISKKTKLQEICRLKQGKYLSPSEMSEVASNDKRVPVIGGNGILGFTDKHSYAHDVLLITCRGSKCGLLQWVKGPVYVSNNAIACDTGDSASNLFIRYLLASVDFSDVISGSAQPQITLSALGPKEIDVLQDPSEVERIVNFLGSTDSLIAGLLLENSTLEAIAQTLFKSWFVNFDPVHAKAAGEAPAGMSPELAALFPSEFEESELGLIPKGWRVSKIEDLILRQPVGKKFDQKTVTATGKVPVYDQGKSGVIGFHDEEPGVRASEDNPVCVFSNHTCYYRFIANDFSAIQNVLPYRGKLDINIDWLWCATNGLQKFVEYKGHWPDFMIHKVVVPTPEIAMAFGGIVRPLYKIVWNNQTLSSALGEVRDELLPRLISGKIRIEEAEEVVAEVLGEMPQQEQAA